MARPKLSKSGWNERLKLLATSLNAVGLAVFGFGVLAPGFSAAADPTGSQTVFCAAILVGLHLSAQWLLRWLRD